MVKEGVWDKEALASVVPMIPRWSEEADYRRAVDYLRRNWLSVFR